MNARSSLWLILAACLLTATLQIVLSTRQCLWADEIFSLATATGHSLEHSAADADPGQGDFVEAKGATKASVLQSYISHQTPRESPRRVIRAVLRSDTSPPLYYLCLYLWTSAFGTSDVVLRLLSVCFSVACVPFVAGLARRSSGPAAILPACLLFAISPLALYYGTEVRMYSLLLLCVVANAWSGMVLQGRGAAFGYFLLWVCSSAAGFLTHYFFLFPWAATLLFLLLFPGRVKRQWLVAGAFLTALAIAPWYVPVLSAPPHWRITQGWLHLRPQSFHRTRAIRTDFLQYFSSSGYGLWGYQRWSSLAATAIFALILASVLWRQRWKVFQGGQVLLWFWFLAACAAPSAMDIMLRTYAADAPRYALAALPAACLLAGYWISFFPPLSRLLILLIIAALWMPPTLTIYRQRARNKQPLQAIGHNLNETVGASDLVLVHSIPSGVIGVARYCHPNLAIASWVGQLGTRRVPASLDVISSGRKRIFFVKVHEVGEPAPEEGWLQAHSAPSREKRFELGKVTEFRPREDVTF